MSAILGPRVWGGGCRRTLSVLLCSGLNCCRFYCEEVIYHDSFPPETQERWKQRVLKAENPSLD